MVGYWGCCPSPDLLPDMPRRLYTRVSLDNLILKQDSLSHSPAIVRLYSPHSNNIWAKLLSSHVRDLIMSNTLLHAAQGPTMVTSESKHRCKSSISTAVERRNQGMLLAIHPEIIATHMEAAASLGWSLYHANHATDGTLPSELPQVTRKSTTTNYHPCIPSPVINSISNNNETQYRWKQALSSNHQWTSIIVKSNTT